jgi:hypothetical protein
MNIVADSALRLSCINVSNRPNKTGQFARHSHTDLVDLHPTGVQARKATGQAQLCFPGHVADRLGQLLLTLLRPMSDTRLEAVIPRRLGQQSPRVCIAGLGDTAAGHPITTGMFRRHKPR